MPPYALRPAGERARLVVREPVPARTAAARGVPCAAARRVYGLFFITTRTCVVLYAAHVAYLKLWRWNYTYNMAANVAVGLLQNSLWTWFSFQRWRESRRTWAILPGVVVAWIMSAMSLELLDFPPLWGALDAHSLWHLGTIGPTILWYRYARLLSCLVLPYLPLSS